MKKILMFLLIVFCMLSCGNPKKDIKNDLEKLGVALEELNQEIKIFSEKGSEIFKKEQESMDSYRRVNEPEEIKKEKAAKAAQRQKSYIDEMKALKTPNVKKISEIIGKMEKNISKIKSNNEIELQYYSSINYLIEETKMKIKNIEDFKTEVEKTTSALEIQFLSNSLNTEGLVYYLKQIQAYPI